MLSEDEIAGNFAENLAILLESRGLSQCELAELSGLTQGAVSHILTKRRVPSIITAAQIADALTVSLDLLLREPRKKISAPVS